MSGYSHSIHASIESVFMTCQGSYYYDTQNSQLGKTGGYFSLLFSVPSIFLHYESLPVGMKVPSEYQFDFSVSYESSMCYLSNRILLLVHICCN